MELIKKLNELGVQLTAKDNDLKIKAPKGVLTSELISQIKEEKANLLAIILSSSDSSKIQLSEIKDYYPLSPTQLRLWVLSQFEGGSVAYNIPGVFKMKGSLNIELLTQSFRYLIGRHESLRTRFVTRDEEVYQQIINEEDIVFNIEKQDVAEEKVNELITNFFATEFDLSSAPLLKAQILKTSEDDYYLLFAIHHIIGDGWSIEVFIKEFIYVYNQLLQDKKIILSELRIQYKDYILWLESEEIQKRLLTQANYWKEQLSGELPVLELPSYRKRPPIKTYNGSTKLYDYSKKLSERLNAYCQEQGVTLYMSLLAGINGLFYRYTNSRDIIIGLPFAGRSHPELENQIGLYLNTLAIRTRFESTDSFESLLDKQKQTLLEAYENQDYPFDRIIEDLSIKRDTSRSALFDVMVALQNQKGESIELDNLQITSYQEINRAASQFDLTFSFSEDEDGLHLRLEYNNDIYDAEQIDAFCSHLERFFESALRSPNESISTLPYLSEEEEKELQYIFNDTQVDYPDSKTVVQQFREQVKKTPNAIAIADEEKQLTYIELENLSNALANNLLSTNLITKETLIGVELERSEWLVISIFAVLKTGGAYVAIDPTYPRQRIEYIKEDSQSTIVINDDYISNFKQTEKNTQAPKVQIDVNQLAYVIYTSGSTGKPKGVMIEHRSLLNLCYWHQEEYDLSQNSRSILYSSVGFDASVWEIFPYLCFGGCLFPIVTDDIRLDPDQLCSFLAHHKITHCFLPPKVVSDMHDSLIPKGIKILSGSEVLAVEEIEGCELYNNYGPTENTVIATVHKVTKEDTLPLPIGKPISNVQAYVLSDEHQLQPKGVVGELCISGLSLSRGYLNRPKLTKEKFVPHPFSEGARMYKTGDLVKWLPDGKIEFIGRKDTQVKIRGYRIELGEIENALIHQENILQAVVKIISHKAEKYIVAYVVSRTDLELDIEEVKRLLRDFLPEYMIPNHIITISTLPLTPNGKIDKKALPEIVIDKLISKAYVAPRNEIEKQMVEIWQEVLEVEKVGISDNFFELGGHSLKVTRLINKLKKVLSSSITVKEIFANPTIASLSEKISNSHYQEIPKFQDKAYFPLTSSQKLLWVLSKFEDGNRIYYIPGAFEVKGRLNKNLLEEAFKYILSRHDSLRTRFIEIDGQAAQQILPIEELKIFIEKDNVRPEQEKALIEEFYKAEFILSESPLVKFKILQTSEERNILLFAIHHIICDGWSMQIFIKELLYVYNQLHSKNEINLPNLRIQYSDYAMWLQGEDMQGLISKQGAYWHHKLSGEIPVLNLPSTNERPLVKTFNGANITYEFSKETYSRLSEFCQINNVTLFMSLMSAINGLFYRYTGETDIILGTPIAGRSNSDLEHQIGLYVNTLAIRTSFNDDDSFIALLSEQKQTLLDAYEHQNYPFDRLVEEIVINRDTSRSALFDVIVVMQNHDQVSSQISGIEMSPYQGASSEVSAFDLSFAFWVDTDVLHLKLQYNTDIYSSSQINAMCIHLEAFINAAIKDPIKSISSYKFLTQNESEDLLNEMKSVKRYQEKTTVVDLFNSQVVNYLDHPALVYDDTEMNYSDLDEMSNAFANYLLLNNSEKENKLIGVQLQRSEWLIVTFLGVLKAGFAYVPIDPNYPQARIDHIVSDSKCFLIVDNNFLKGFRSSEKDRKQPQVDIVLSDLAYVIYTSGSTGKPKGVMISHLNLISRISYYKSKFNISSDSTMLFYMSHSFDWSIEEYLAPIMFGAKIIIAPNDFKDNLLQNIQEYIYNYKVTKFNAPPELLDKILSTSTKEDIDKYYKSLTYFITGGDTLVKEIVAKFNEVFDTTLFNTYGPTENTIDSTVWEVTKHAEDDTIYIGKSIEYSFSVILDDNLNLVPNGVIGELYVGGDGLSKGYLYKPQLTERSFIPNPFSEGELIYATGDLVKRTTEGNIEFIGRKDSQVKIRGHRIELQEIEKSIIKNVAAVKKVVVVCKQQNLEKSLIAFIVSDSDIDIVKKETKVVLPSFMIPDQFVKLQKLPVTPNGKIDRKKLVNFELQQDYKPTIVANTATEQIISDIVTKSLNIAQIDVDDDIFNLGMNSLRILQLLAELKKFDFNITTVDIYDYRSIRKLAKFINQSQATSIEEPVKREYDLFREFMLSVKDVKQSSFPATYGQRAGWQMYKENPESYYRNISQLYYIKDAEAISNTRKVFDLLIEKYDFFRSRFFFDEHLHFEVLNEIEYDIAYHDLSSFPRYIQEQKGKVIKDAQHKKAFLLEKDFLFRLSLIKIDDLQHVVVLATNHLMFDGWSAGVLNREFYNFHNMILEGRTPSTKNQYDFKHYALWKDNFFKSPELSKKQIEFWKDYFKGFGDYPHLPYIPDLSAKELGSGYSVFLEASYLKGLKEIAVTEKLSLYMILVASACILLHSESSKNDLTVGFPHANRRFEELEGIVGEFVGPVPFRTELNPESTFSDLLKSVSSQIHDISSRPKFPSYYLKEMFDSEGYHRFSMFVQQVVTNNNKIADENYKHIPETQNARFEYGIYPYEFQNGLELLIKYKKKYYSADAIEDYTAKYLDILKMISKEKDFVIENLFVETK